MTEPDVALPPVAQALDHLGIPYRLFRHPGQVHSLEQAAQERSQRPEQVVRSIVFRLAQDSFAMVLVGGPGQISWPALRAHVGQSRLTMASEAEVLAITGYPLGAVAPFGLPAPMRILLDNGLRPTPQTGRQELSLGSGVRYTAVILRQEDLLRALTLQPGPPPEFGEFLKK